MLKFKREGSDMFYEKSGCTVVRFDLSLDVIAGLRAGILCPVDLLPILIYG